MNTTPQFFIALICILIFDAKQKEHTPTCSFESIRFFKFDSFPSKRLICNFSGIENYGLPSPDPGGVYNRCANCPSYLDTVQSFFRMRNAATYLSNINEGVACTWHDYKTEKRYIGINIDAVQKESKQSERQIIYCLLAHEYYHLCDWRDLTSKAAKLISEISADIASGEFMATHLNEGMEFFHLEMVGFYSSSSKLSSSHPEAKFRINAAKAGWLEPVKI